MQTSHLNMKMDKYGLTFGRWTGKKKSKTTSIPVHLAFKWDGMKSNQAYFMFDPTFINSEIALNN